MPGAPPHERRSRRLPRAERERQLLDVAEQLFIEQGYDGTTIEDVAHRAGVSRPIVYAHHGSKEGLYVACVRRARRHYEERLLDAMGASEDTRTQIEAVGEMFFSIMEENPKRWMVLYGGSAVPLFGELGQRLTELRQHTIGLISTLLRATCPALDAERATVLAHAVSGVSEQLGRWWLNNRDVPRQRLVEYYTDFIWRGLEPFAGHPAPGSGSTSS